MRASQRPGASSSFGVGSISARSQSRFSASTPARSITPRTERGAPLVVLAVDGEPEQTLDEALGLAALEAVARHRLVDLAERRDQPVPTRSTTTSA